TRKGTVDTRLQRIVVGMSDGLPLTELTQSWIGLLQWVDGKTGGVEAAKNYLPIRRGKCRAKPSSPLDWPLRAVIDVGHRLAIHDHPGWVDVVSFRSMNPLRANMPNRENGVP